MLTCFWRMIQSLDRESWIEAPYLNKAWDLIAIEQ